MVMSCPCHKRRVRSLGSGEGVQMFAFHQDAVDTNLRKSEAKEEKEMCPRWPPKQLALMLWQLLNSEGNPQGSDSESVSYDGLKGTGAQRLAPRRENPT